MWGLLKWLWPLGLGLGLFLVVAAVVVGCGVFWVVLVLRVFVVLSRRLGVIVVLWFVVVVVLVLQILGCSIRRLCRGLVFWGLRLVL